METLCFTCASPDHMSTLGNGLRAVEGPVQSMWSNDGLVGLQKKFSKLLLPKRGIDVVWLKKKVTLQCS